MAKTALTTISDKNPIGMIVQSMLTEVQFQSLNGNSWVLANGRDISGSRYASITGSATIPDLRGVVLRGKNNGRSDGNQNPDGDLALGQYQGDANGSHDHARALVSIGGGSSQGPAFGGNGNFGYGNTTVATGGNETRARNITVNTFIKIND
jgi:hypothetical protein